MERCSEAVLRQPAKITKETDNDHPDTRARAARLRLVLGAVVAMLSEHSAAANAQVVEGVQKGAREGNKAAGPVGGVLGGAIGGVVGRR